MSHPPFITLPAFRFDGVNYGFFTRDGGVSEGHYASLNTGLGSKDNPDHVRENRRRVASEMDVEKLVSCHQIHSNKVITVDKPWADEDRPQADAFVTKQRGIGLGVLTADCGPILFYDTSNDIIGAAHAGWKGAIGGVLEETIAAMENLGGNIDSIQAIIGPCIQQKSYEVGPDFPDAFIKQDEANRTFFVPAQRDKHFMFDLPGYIRHRLHQAGLTNVHSVGLNTYNDPKKFFSYRRATHRSEPVNGSLISVIALV